jgi:serine O-acetyltransferase
MRSTLDRAARRVLALTDTIRFFVSAPLVLAYRLTDAQSLIDGDVDHWLAVLGTANDDAPGGGRWPAARSAPGAERELALLLFVFPEFRAVYYHRLRHGNSLGELAARVLTHIYKPSPGISLLTDEIGPGLFIAHGNSTILSAERIGANCYVHQGVTVGWDYKSERTPIIGEGVFIGAGAVILGAVTIGDFVRIGANAVVLTDVPSWSTAVGAPARILPMNVDVEELFRVAEPARAELP